MKLEDSFRELRKAWFNAKLRSFAHEREWESEEEEERRELDNARRKKVYDAQTEAIINGQSASVVPHCWNDLVKD